MDLLLDTHTWLWWQSAPQRLNERTRDLISDPGQTLLFSAASSWEIAIKYALKKLDLSDPPGIFVPERLARDGMTPVPIAHAHALRVAELPLHHRDPFDRLLIAQAQVDGLTIATGDPQFLLYDVDVLWAAAGDLPSAVHDAPQGRRRKKRAPSRSGARRQKSK